MAEADSGGQQANGRGSDPFAQELLVELGRRIRAARYVNGMRVPDLAAKLGWSKEKLYRIEGGRTPMFTIVDLAYLADATGQTLEYFFGVTSPDPTNDLPVLTDHRALVKA